MVDDELDLHCFGADFRLPNPGTSQKIWERQPLMDTRRESIEASLDDAVADDRLVLLASVVVEPEAELAVVAEEDFVLVVAAAELADDILVQEPQ